MTKQRFLALDAMRGVAALCVLIGHVFTRAGLLPRSYLAVDFFFVLSGFVLAQAYGQRDLSFSRFMRVRFVRFYPLYLVGLLLGLAVYLGAHRFDFSVATATLLGLLFLPTTFDVPGAFGGEKNIYPFNGVSWSLFFELAINAVWFALLPYLSNRKLIAILIVSGIAFAATGIYYQNINLGAEREALLAGSVRVTYSFFLGTAVYKLWTNHPPTFKIPVSVAAIILLVIMGVGGLGVVYEILVVLFLFPTFVYLVASSEPPKWATGTCLFLGVASYAIYVVHLPLLALLVSLNDVFEPWTQLVTRPAIVTMPIYFIVLIAMVLVLDRYFDVPIRQRFGKRRSS